MEYSFDDLIDAAGDRFNPLPEGRYTAVVSAAEPTVSKNSGNQMIAVSLKVAEGPESGKSPKTVYVSKPGPGTKPEKLEGAARMFLTHLTAVGIKVETLRELKPTMEQIAASMVGKRVNIEVKHETFRGEQQAGVNGPLRAPEDGAVEVTQFPDASPMQEVVAATNAASSGFDEDPGF